MTLPLITVTFHQPRNDGVLCLDANYTIKMSTSGTSICEVTKLALFVLLIGQELCQGQGPVGPTCYSCDNTDNPALCSATSRCTAEQVCSVQEVIQPHGDVHFWSGCEGLDVCADLSEQQHSTAIIGKREVSYSNQRCVYCCSTDKCNHNCTSFVNLALHKPAYQSSVSFNGTADLAVDGDVTRNYFHGSCTHNADGDNYPWWTVDLGNTYTITKVKIYERNDAGADGRVFQLSVLVSDRNATQLPRDSTSFSTCGGFYGHSSDGDVIVIDCPKKMAGRWVRVQETAAQQNYFHLCEVEVFGY